MKGENEIHDEDVLAGREFGPDEDELLLRMTACMRKADEIFDRVGGSTKHHVRDCLLPLLPKYGLELRLKKR